MEAIVLVIKKGKAVTKSLLPTLWENVSIIISVISWVLDVTRFAWGQVTLVVKNSPLIL